MFFIARADLPADASGRFATVFGPFDTKDAAIETVRTFKPGHDYHLYAGALDQIVHLMPAVPALPAPSTDEGEVEPDAPVTVLEATPDDSK